MEQNNIIKEINITEESELRNKGITSLFWKYSIFALAGLSLQITQTFADGAFVGNGVGPMGMAVITVTQGFWEIAMGLFGLFGIGGSTLAAIKLGNGDEDGARNVYANMLCFSFLFTLLLSVIILLNLDNVLFIMGATPELLAGARKFSIIFLAGLPLCVISTIAYYFTRIAERPFAASVAYIVPATLAIIAEYIAIFKLHMGIGASSLAMSMGLGLGVFLVPYLQFGNTAFKLKAYDFKINFKIIFESCKIGFAMFIVPVSTSIAVIVTNNMIIENGGNEIHLAAFGTFTYITFLFYMVTTAFITGMQPIVSYNYGAKQYDRVRRIIRIGIAQSSLGIIAIIAITYAFLEPIIIFLGGDAEPELLSVTKDAAKIYISLYAFGNIAQIVSGYFMSIERNGLAILNGIARMIIFAVPLLFIIPHFFGLKGVWMSQPLADTLSCILAIVCIVNEYKRLGKFEV